MSDLTPAPAQGSTREARVDVALMLIGVAILFAVPHQISGDGEARYETLERLVTTGKLASARYSMLTPLLATPLYLLGRALGDARGVTALFNTVLFALALPLFWRELRDRKAMLLLVYASMFPNHVLAFYGEPLTAIAVSLGVLWLSRDRPLQGWAAIVLGAVNTPATILGVAAIAVRDAHRRKSYLPLAAPLVVLVLTRLESLVVRGSLFTTGYEGDAGFRTALPYSGLPGFSYPFFLGLLAIFLSFGKGLVFFAPGLFLPLAKGAPDRLRWVHGTLLWFVGGLVLAYAKWWAWYGGSFWGPRFFLVASVPACLALATQLANEPEDRPEGQRERSLGHAALLAVALLLSFWVGVNGLVFDQNGLRLCSENGWALEPFCLYVPEMSVLWHPLVDFAGTIPDKTRPLAIGVCAFWAIVCAWTGRDLFAALAAGLRRAAARSLERARG